MMITENDLEYSMIEGCRIFHYGTLSMTHEICREATRRAIDAAKDAGAVLSFDPNLREPLWKSLDEAREQILYGMGQCDVLKISDNEIVWLTGEEDFDAGAAWIRKRFPNITLILVSVGKEGSRAYMGSLRAEVPALVQEKTIETTGAGDTFCACILNYILEHGLKELTEEQLKEMLTFANGAASIVTTRKGALRVMPSKAEVEALISAR